MMRSAQAQSKLGKTLLAVVAVLGVIVISSIATAPQASAATLQIDETDGFVAFTANQPSLEQCVGSVVGQPVLSSPGKSPVRTATVNFSKANTCSAVTLTITTVDKDGGLSAGTLDPLPLGAKSNVVVNFTDGSARKEEAPVSYLLVS